MTYRQHIPFYIHKFRDYPWKTYESKHYIFNVEEGSLADKEIELIKSRQEEAFGKIIHILDLKEPSQKIIYYFYSSRAKKAELMGDGWYGQSIYDEFTIHGVYNEDDKVVGEHEDTHLLTLQLGYPVSFLQEGIAEAMVGKSMFGNDHDQLAQDGLRRGLQVNFEDLIATQQAWLDTPEEEAEFYYSVSGSFIKYLLETFGFEKFKKLYELNSRDNTREANLEIFKQVYGKQIEALAEDWRKTKSWQAGWEYEVS